jgi:SAM-dependent methyltransferase
MKKRKQPEPVTLELKHPRDLAKLPSDSISELSILHKLEYVPARQRIAFMEEVWRVLVPKGKAIILTAHWASPRAYQDPLYEMPPICENWYLYFWQPWLKTNHPDRSIRCNFEFGYGYNWDAETAGREASVQAFWVKHYLGAALDLQMVLTKLPLVKEK